MIAIPDYSKEPVDIIEQNQQFAVGDKVRFAEYYLGNYCGLGSLANQEGTIVKMVARTIQSGQISYSDRPMYLEMYGKLTEYPLVCLYIEFPGKNEQYLVSPFGVRKI